MRTSGVKGDRRVLMTYCSPLAHDNCRRMKCYLRALVTSHITPGRLHENYWRVKGDRRALVTREMLMVALQNTQHVLIRATDFIDATRAE